MEPGDAEIAAVLLQVISSCGESSYKEPGGLRSQAGAAQFNSLCAQGCRQQSWGGNYSRLGQLWGWGSSQVPQPQGGEHSV